MNTAAKGRRNERKTERYLQALGYSTISSRASRGKVDVVAWNAVELRVIQVKSNADSLGAAVREGLELLPVPPNGRVEVWWWRDRARTPRIEVIPAR